MTQRPQPTAEVFQLAVRLMIRVEMLVLMFVRVGPAILWTLHGRS